MFQRDLPSHFRKKSKVLSGNERSIFQLLDAMRLNDKGMIISYKTTAKTHATMDKKISIPLYAEHLHLLMTKCGWRVWNVRFTILLNKVNLKKIS